MRAVTGAHFYCLHSPALPSLFPTMSDRTVWWEAGRVRMIDQRMLPLEYRIAEFATVAEVAFAIKDMAVRGALAIGATAAFGMVLAAQASTADKTGSLLPDLRRAKAEPGYLIGSNRARHVLSALYCQPVPCQDSSG
jgi:hypothetical protein